MSALMTVLAGGPLLAAGAGFVTGRWSARRALAAARRAVLRDPLTGLANRAGLLADLDRRSAGWEPFAVLMADLNGFKAVNDTYGHAVGDVVLIAVAERLSALVAGTGFAARLSGDEFVVVAPAATPVLGRLLGYDVVRAVAAPVDVNGRSIRVGASVGVVQALPGDDVRALLRSADIAMYRAKSGRGQGGVAEFDALASLAEVVEERPGVRERELPRLGWTLDDFGRSLNDCGGVIL